MNLTEEQKKWWQRLRELLANTANQPHIAVRQLMIEIVENQPNQNQISIPGQILRRFPCREFQTKEAFLNYHRQNGKWAEDALLFPLFHALGYNVVMHLAGTSIPPYQAISQAQSELRADIVNYGAIEEGFHWELLGHTNAGGGNCGIHTATQRFMLDIPKVLPEFIQVVKPEQKDPEPLDLVEIETKWQAFISKEEERLIEAKNILSSMTTQQLISLYHKMVNGKFDQYTYLKDRMEKYAPEENGLPPDFFKNILSTGIYDQGSEFILREQLIHAMGREAWSKSGAFELVKKQASVVDVGLFSIEPTKQEKMSQPVEVKRQSIRA